MGRERERKVKHTREIQLKDKDTGAVGVEGRAIKTDRNEDGDTNRNTNQPLEDKELKITQEGQREELYCILE